MTTETKTHPTHRIYAVPKSGEKKVWLPMGALWVHADGKGFNQRIQAAPSLAQAADLPVHLRAYSLPYPISYSHNYGPGPQAGTFAYYDGPSTNACRQGAATYLGQDRRRHPCF